jgi:hypothetical protein
MEPNQLQCMLTYRNEDIISRFTDQFAIDDTSAELIFADTLRFMYLCQLPGIFIPDHLLIIDEMWHNFILFTREYQKYCQTHFRRYFHHLPASKAEKEKQRLANEADPEVARLEFSKKLSYVVSCAYDHLGPDVTHRWFREYPVTYSKTNINELRK